MARNLFIISSRIITNRTFFSKNTFLNISASYVNNLRKYSEVTKSTDSQTATLSDSHDKCSSNIETVTIKLQNSFDFSLTQVKELLKQYPKLKKHEPDFLEKNFNASIEAGITKDTLLKYPMLLTIENINYKLKYLKQINVDINLIAPIIFANFFVLKQIVQEAKIEADVCPYGNRIVYMSKILNIPVPEICEKIIHHIYVLRCPLERLEKMLKVLLSHGVEPRNILNDCWALRYNPAIAEARLELATQANVLKVKTWMIRCTDNVFQRCINRQIENRKILGSNSSVEEYLSKRLECSVENAKYLTEKYPAITKMNISKMKDILDFLYEQGYTPGHVCRVPRIMIHSQETTKQRIQELKELGHMPPSLAVLCKSKRDFDKILKKFVKRKNNGETEKKKKLE